MLTSAMSGNPSAGIRAELRRARESGRVHGAYLLEGPAGTGKTETALWFARLLLCAEQRPDPCETCRECLRSALHGDEGEQRPAHPDLLWVRPEGANLKVDQVRALQRGLGLVANEGGWRIGILLQAERMRREAANALLKTLEEPPPRTTLLLVTERGEALPLTVRSRTVRLRFLPEREETVRAALEEEGLDPEDAWLAATLGGGTQTAAAGWAARHLETAREFRGWVEEAAERSDSDILDFAESFRGGGEAGRERAEVYLDVHQAVARRRVEESLGEEATGTLEGWLRQADRAAEARREIRRRNLNPQMLIEALLLDLKAHTPERRV
jgi:DNA polymerase-3 subunit delta'